jgi:hypothetical protein
VGEGGGKGRRGWVAPRFDGFLASEQGFCLLRWWCQCKQQVQCVSGDLNGAAGDPTASAGQAAVSGGYS